MVYFLEKKFAAKEIMTFLFSITSVVGYFFYNQFLRENYGSNFLASTMLPKNLSNFFEIIKLAFDNWVFTYFTVYHYIFYGLMLFVFIFLTLFKKNTLSKIQKELLTHVGIIFSGAFLFFILVEFQFIHHDYYFLDSFFPVCVLLLIFLLSIIPGNKVKIKWITVTACLVFSALFIVQCTKTEAERNATGDWDITAQVKKAFTNSEFFLAESGVKQNDKILVLNSISSNIPFILMNHKGYAVIHWEREQIDEALHLDFKYIIVVNKFLEENVLKSYPELKDHLVKVNDNGRFSIFTYKK
jgi:hypothetical protein